MTVPMQIVHYQPSGFEDGQWAQHDCDLATAIGAKLGEIYPDYLWFVEVDSRGGMAHISMPALTNNWRYNIKLTDLHADPGMKSVMRAGGEILERWKIPRKGLDVAAFRAAMRHRLHGHKDKPPT